MSKAIYQSHADYMRRAFTEPSLVAQELAHVLDGVDFDSFIVTGLSGCLIADRLAQVLGKPYAVVRKDDAAHSTRKIEGTIGTRWVFVDDFISSGTTFMRVCEAINENTRRNATTFVGVAYYEPMGRFFNVPKIVAMGACIQAHKIPGLIPKDVATGACIRAHKIPGLIPEPANRMDQEIAYLMGGHYD